jgi:serine/threonine-protein kinase
MAFHVSCDSSTLLMPQNSLVETCDRQIEGTTDARINRPLMDCPTQFGEYELLEEIGRGSMGVVYKARQATLKRIVALKMVHPAQVRRPGAVDHLVLEAELAAQLDHPGFISVHGFSQQLGHAFICMPFVDGENLEARLQRGPLEIDEIVRLVADLGDAIQHMHERGIVHRDLKPANILLDRWGKPRVGDFGLAIRVGGVRQVSPVIAGTPAYMSPEQASGHNGRIGPQSDIYSLGVILYHCLTGRAPFAGKTSYSILQQVIQTEPPIPRDINPSIPVELERITLRCLRKDPTERYGSAAELACDLRRFAGQPMNRSRTDRARR